MLITLNNNNNNTNNSLSNYNSNNRSEKLVDFLLTLKWYNHKIKISQTEFKN